jgi:hypothetical protein
LSLTPKNIYKSKAIYYLKKTKVCGDSMVIGVMVTSRARGEAWKDENSQLVGFEQIPGMGEYISVKHEKDVDPKIYKVQMVLHSQRLKGEGETTSDIGAMAAQAIYEATAARIWAVEVDDIEARVKALE